MVTVQDLSSSISREIEAKLKVRGPDLRRQLRQVGRLMPGPVRRDARAVAGAEGGHSSAADLPRLEAAERRVVAWLRSIEPAKRPVDTRLLILLGAALIVLVGLAGALVVVAWQGL